MTPYALIISEDEVEREVLQSALHEAAIQAILTDNSGAVDLIEKQVFDLVFVDMNGGIELAKLIRQAESKQKTPIILLADDTNPTLTQIAFQAGVTFILHKPLSQEKIQSLLQITTSKSLAERRRFHRVKVRRPIEIEHGGIITRGYTEDISLNGALVRTSIVFAIKSRVTVRLELPNGLITTNGIVSRIATGDALGIHLYALDGEQSKQLQDFLLPLIAPIKPELADCGPLP